MKLKMDKSSYKSAENYLGKEKATILRWRNTSAKTMGRVKVYRYRHRGINIPSRLMALKMFLVVKLQTNRTLSNGTWLHSKTKSSRILEKCSVFPARKGT